MSKIKFFLATKGFILGMIFAGVLAFGIYSALAAWVGPPGSPPTCPATTPGCNVPINISTTTQNKEGSLTIGGKKICLEDGTNCPVGGGGGVNTEIFSATPNYYSGSGPGTYSIAYSHPLQKQHQGALQTVELKVTARHNYQSGTTISGSFLQSRTLPITQTRIIHFNVGAAAGGGTACFNDGGSVCAAISQSGSNIQLTFSGSKSWGITIIDYELTVRG